MKFKKIKYITIIAGVAMVTLVGCKKDFFDTNENPNSPTKLSIRETLPTAELAIAQAIGNDLQIAGGLWSQHWAQNFNSSQYKAYDLYNIAVNAQQTTWNLLYADALTDLNYVITTAKTEGKTNYAAVATILKAYTFQILTDAFGDIPFSEAGKGAEGILSPKYDSQKNVYVGIVNILKEGRGQINLNSTDHPGNEDFIFHGDMELWNKFANTLLLKTYMRISSVDAGWAQAGIAELQAGNVEFIDAEETAMITYSETGGNTHPLYAAFTALSSTRNLIASSTAIKSMSSLNDPRINVLYTKAGGGYLGVPNGYLGADNTGGFLVAPSAVSYPGDYTGGSPNAASAKASVIFMSDYESYFLQAEAASKGWLAGNEQQLYEDGILLSFQSMGLPDSTAKNYSAQPNVNYALQLDKSKAIYFQKWFAMCGTQNFEAWSEGRRTGYIEANMGNSLADNKFFTRSLSAGAATLPARVLYPNTEATRNANFPGQKILGNKVWWAK